MGRPKPSINPPKRPALPLREMSMQQRRFVEEYIIDFDAVNAARRAGYSESYARDQSYLLLRMPYMLTAINEARKAQIERIQFRADEVIRDHIAIHLADPNELIEHRRVCCRHCWGKDFLYQYTRGEHRKALADHQYASAKTPELAPFDPQGGVGYDERRDPNPKCPECFGDGTSKVILKDTRHLSHRARLLYQGVKVTRDGIEIKMRSQDRALELLGQHFGLYKAGQGASADGDQTKVIIEGGLPQDEG